MSPGRTVALVIAAALVAVALAAVVILGVVGIEKSVSAGGQTEICGVKVGVTAEGQTVRLPGFADGPLEVGDRVRLAPWCVVEIVGVDATALDATDAEADGGGAVVRLRWRLW